MALLSDVSTLTTLPLFGDTHLMGILFDEEDNEKLKFLNDAFLGSRTFGKGIYISWIPYFKTRKGKNSSYHVEDDCLLLSWFLLPSASMDGLNILLFPLAIQLA